MTFDDDSAVDTVPTLLDQTRKVLTDFATPFRYASLLLLFVLAWALLLRPVQKQLLSSMKALPATSAPPALLQAEAKHELTLRESSASGDIDADTAKLKRELSDLVQAEPAVMTRTLQTWLREDRA